MSKVFLLAAVLLVGNGILHLVKVFLTPGEFLPMFAMVLFGLAYLVIGFLLFRKTDAAVLWGIIVPLVGLLMALASISSATGVLTYVFIVIDLIVIACCVMLYMQSRSVIHRVR